MHDAISPYALLSACKPSASPIQTAYDLYSQAQQRDIRPADKPPAPLPKPEEKPGDTAYPPPRRTHYIADIQSRHNAAIRKTPMNLHPLS